MFVQDFRKDFTSIATAVNELCETENSYLVDGEYDLDKLTNIDKYTDYGFKALGKMIAMPAPFVADVNSYNEFLARTIIKDRLIHHFHQNGNRPFTVREFNDQIAGVVSNKYAYFDDNEVIEIMSGSTLTELDYQNVIITPERLHLRAIDKEPFHIDGDDSDLFFAYFIDNSMVGGSSFRVRLGIYRKACTNGLIIQQREFVLCKQVHRGTKDIATEFNANVALISEKKDAIIALLQEQTTAQSKIEEMATEFRADYIAKRLNTSKAEAEKIINLYQLTYGGKTKWALTNAITEFARDIKDIDRREMLEARALRVA